jgi:hypothetical protein
MLGRVFAIALGAAFLAGCGTTLPGAQPGAVTNTFRDPQGDAFGTSGTNYDVTQVRTVRTSDELAAELTFAQGVFLPPPGGRSTSSQLSGIIELDTDQNAGTGNRSACPTTAVGPIGVDFYIAMTRRDGAGQYTVYDASGVPRGSASVSVSGGSSNVVTVRVGRAALGGDDLLAHLVVLAGNDSDPSFPLVFHPTDCAPDAGGAVVTRQQLPRTGR